MIQRALTSFHVFCIFRHFLLICCRFCRPTASSIVEIWKKTC